MDILEKLKADHEKQRKLVDAISATSGDSAERRELYATFRDELMAHATAEERTFYSPLISEKGGTELSRHSVAEHKQIDDLVKLVDEADMDTGAWLVHFKNLGHKVVHHVDEEESDVFPVAVDLLPKSERERIGAEFAEVKSDVKEG